MAPSHAAGVSKLPLNLNGIKSKDRERKRDGERGEKEEESEEGKERERRAYRSYHGPNNIYYVRHMRDNRCLEGAPYSIVSGCAVNSLW